MKVNQISLKKSITRQLESNWIQKNRIHIFSNIFLT